MFSDVIFRFPGSELWLNALEKKYGWLYGEKYWKFGDCFFFNQNNSYNFTHFDSSWFKIDDWLVINRDWQHSQFEIKIFSNKFLHFYRTLID